MKELPNNMVSTLLRCVPLIIANVNAESMNKNLRLNNAVRQVKIILKRLEKIENGK